MWNFCNKLLQRLRACFGDAVSSNLVTNLTNSFGDIDYYNCSIILLKYTLQKLSYRT